MVGKYMELLDVYKLLIEVMIYVGIQSCIKVNLCYIDFEDIEQQGISLLEGVDVILVLGGFGLCGVEGKISIVQYVCENKIFYLGICLGMQVVVIEYVCNVFGWSDVNFIEFDKFSGYLVVGLIIEWQDVIGVIEICIEVFDLGGIMCLGVQECQLQIGILVYDCYVKDVIVECYCYCYEVNNNLLL